MKIGFFTLGCKVNQYETEAIKEIFKSNNWDIVDFSDIADAYLINTCTVTSLSDRKSRQMIRRAINLNPDAVVAVVGCYAQVSKDEIEKIEGVSVIIGNKDKVKAYELIEKAAKDKKKHNIVSIMGENDNYEDLMITTYDTKTRAIIKVQDGCNNFCSYCIIPYARGRIRSRNISDIENEIKLLVFNGFKEIVLAGIHVSSYGKDLNDTSLIDLLEKIDKIDGLLRIRLSSIEPLIFTDDFIDRLKRLDKLCHHFHISLQSGCDETLKRMNRKYDTDFFENVVNKLKNAFSDLCITTDVIVGFPGETDDEFLATLDFIKRIGFSFVHTFKYSIRKGTKAADMENQVDPAIKEERSKKVIKLADELRKSYLDNYIGQTVCVLFEKETKGYRHGFTNNYLDVYVKNDNAPFDEILNVKIKGLKFDGLEGIIL